MVSERAVPKVAIIVFGLAETLIFLEGCHVQVLIEHVSSPCGLGASCSSGLGGFGPLAAGHSLIPVSVQERKDEFNALLALSYWLLAPPPGESAPKPGLSAFPVLSLGSGRTAGYELLPGCFLT